MAATLGEIAVFLGAKLQGDASAPISGVAELKLAGPSELSFLSNPKYAPQLADSRAGAVLLSPADLPKAGSRPVLVSSNPYRDFALVSARYFSKRAAPALGVHPLASVSTSAKVHPQACIGAFVFIDEGAEVGARTVMHPFSYLGPGAKTGEDCLLHPFAVVMEGCILKNRVILQSGAVIGADGFGFAPDPPKGYVKIPQMGNVVLEDDVEVQANACVDRGALGSTLIGQGSKIDNLVQVAHNVRVGKHTVLAAQAGISGSTEIGNWVTFAGQSAAGGHLKIGDEAIVTGQAGAGKDVPAKGMVSGSPAQPTLEHHRGLAELKKLPELKKRIKELEARLAALEEKLGKGK